MDAEVWDTVAEEERRPVVPGEIQENTFYVFDDEALMAYSHAVEDIAFEEANGTMLTCCQDFKNFPPDLVERYSQLAATIDRVEVVGGGRAPRARGGLKFGSLARSALKEFRVSLFESRGANILFIAQEMASSRDGAGKKYIGFYSMSPEVVERLSKDILGARHGKNSGLSEFNRLQVIDRAAKQINIEFSREKDLVGAAIGKLQTNCQRYNVHNFTRDLQKSLDHLDQWKIRLPQMLEEADCH